MAEFNATSPSDKTPERVAFDVEAIKLLQQRPEQLHALYMQILGDMAGKIQSLENRLRTQVERYETNTRPPIRNIVGDPIIDVNINEEQASISIDEDALREALPPLPPPVTVDQYRHCTDPATYPDLYLPSFTTDANLDEAGGVVYLRIERNNSKRCYYLFQRNVQHELSDYDAAEKMASCSVCYDIPTVTPDPPTPPPDPPDGDYYTFDGWVVTDLSCTGFGDGSWFVHRHNIITGENEVAVQDDCCCPTPPSAETTADEWWPCDATTSANARYFTTDIYDAAVALGHNDPVLQLSGETCCYKLHDEDVVHAPEELTAYSIVDTCDDTSCEDCYIPNGCAGTTDPNRLRIVNWDNNKLGNIKVSSNGADCLISDRAAAGARWNGQFSSHTAGTCIWEANATDGLEYQHVDAAFSWSVSPIISLQNDTPDYWLLRIPIVRTANYGALGTNSVTAYYRKNTGQSPEGTYTFDVADADNDYINDADCFQMPATLDVETF